MDVLVREMDMNTNNIPPATEKLLNEEARIENERRDTISKVTHELEEIFLREDMTMGDILEVMNLFNFRASKVFSQTKIKYVKEQYDRQ